MRDTDSLTYNSVLCEGCGFHSCPRVPSRGTESTVTLSEHFVARAKDAKMVTVCPQRAPTLQNKINKAPWQGRRGAAPAPVPGMCTVPSARDCVWNRERGDQISVACGGAGWATSGTDTYWNVLQLGGKEELGDASKGTDMERPPSCPE